MSTTVKIITAMGAAFLVGMALPSNAADVTPVKIHACHEDEVVAKSGRCVHPDSAEFRAGYWYAH